MRVLRKCYSEAVYHGHLKTFYAVVCQHSSLFFSVFCSVTARVWFLYYNVTTRVLVCVLQRDHSGLVPMACGGAVYISGVVFFKCDGVVPCAHAIWHCFVLIGALLHYYAVCTHLLGEENRIAHASFAQQMRLQDEL